MEIFREEFERDGTFSIDALDQALREIRASAYNTLYQNQLDTISVRRIDFKMEDLSEVGNYPTDYFYNCDLNFIAENRRLAYRSSQFFEQAISVADTANNPDIFLDTFLIFIDGKFYDSIRVICQESITRMVFDIDYGEGTGIPLAYFNDLVANNAAVTLLVIPNCEFGVYNTNRFMLEKYKDGLSLDRFNIVNNLGTDANYITFVNTNEFLYASVMTDSTTYADMLRFHPNGLAGFDSKFVHLNVFGFRNLYDHITFSGDTKFFDLPSLSNPIPSEAMLVFRNVDGKKYFAHDIYVTGYYPNYYEIIGNDKDEEISIMVFYFDDTTSEVVPFRNEFAIYNEIMGRSVSDYINDTMFYTAKVYKPQEVKYSIHDFRESVETPDHFMYKVNKFKKMIALDPFIVKEYLNRQMNTYKEYYIDCSTVDLSKRERIDNYAEVSYVDEKQSFLEPRYVFTFKNVFGGEFSPRYSMFIDGLYFTEFIDYRTDRYSHLYVPKHLISPDSIIEIEMFFHYEMSKVVTFNDLISIHNMSFRETMFVDTADIYMVAPNNKFIKKDRYQILIKASNGSLIPVDWDSFKAINGEFSLKITDPTLINVPLKVFVRKEAMNVGIIADGTDDDIFVINVKTPISADNVRIFKNGRYLPPNFNVVNGPNELGKDAYIATRVDREPGDVMYAEQVPYVYKVVHYIDTLPDNGVVDLRGILNKPIDLKWYDIYLNGRKLNKKNIQIITAEIFALVGTNSIHNLFVIEKNRAPEVFPLNTQEDILTLLWDTDADFQNTVMNRPIMDNGEIDIIEEIADYYTLQCQLLLRLFNTITGFINPDIDQITPDIQDQFPYLVTDVHGILMNPDRAFDKEIGMPIFPIIP